MDTLDLARWQFGITTVYHFLFVPLTIGLAPIVAALQTAWVRTGDERWLRATRFFGKVFLLNFALGVATGIVQEFQFGMAWSEYSRFVGDVFGAPLAIEGLAAFFLESTFLGLWIFGWDRLPQRLHLATIWLAAFGVNLSAYFIIAANSWMQHPVGVRFDPESGRAELTSIVALLTNNTAVAAFAHTVLASLLTAGTLVAGVSLWWAVRAGRAEDHATAAVFRRVARPVLVLLVVAGIGVAISGDVQARLMFQQQPMKMAAAEAICATEQGAGLSLVAVGDLSNSCDLTEVSLPGLAAFLATGSTDGTLSGVDDLQQAYTERYGEGDYVPILPVTYWSFRLMMGLGLAVAALAVVGLWVTRGGRVPTGSRLGRLALWVVPAPFLANSFGWVFTEMGRQPWLVAPNPTGPAEVRLLTADGVSGLSAGTVALSLVVFTLLYGALAVVWGRLVRSAVLAGLPEVDQPRVRTDADEPLTFAY